MKPELKVKVVVCLLVDHAVDLVLVILYEINLLAFICELVVKFFCSVEVDKVFFMWSPMEGGRLVMDVDV